MKERVFNNLKKFEQFKDPQTFIITDIDGTISEINLDPHGAVVKESMKTRLIDIEKKFKLLIIITGRSLEDAFKMIDIPGALYIGNHGMEHMDDGKVVKDDTTLPYIPIIKNLYEKLKVETSNLHGITLEYKETSIAIHYRKSQKPQFTRMNILKILNNLHETSELQIKEGKMIIELRPP